MMTYQPRQRTKKEKHTLENQKALIVSATRNIKEFLHDQWREDYEDQLLFSDRISILPREVINFILSFENVFLYNDVARKFDLNAEQRNSLPHIVWKAILENKMSDVETVLSLDLKLNQAAANDLGDMLRKKIFARVMTLAATANNASHKKQSETIEKLTIAEALKKYPKIGNQIITSNPIKIKPVSDPSSPTIKNWILDYHSHLGVEHHELMEQGNYLFHSENTRRLSSNDRQTLTEIIKSLEDKTPLKIDASLQKVIFKSAKKRNSRNRLSKTTESDQVAPISPAPLASKQENNNLENLLSSESTGVSSNSKQTRDTLNTFPSSENQNMERGKFSVGRVDISEISESEKAAHFKKDFSRESLAGKHNKQQQQYKNRSDTQEKGDWFLGEKNKEKIFRSNFDESVHEKSNNNKKGGSFRISPMGNNDSRKDTAPEEAPAIANIINLKKQ